MNTITTEQEFIDLFDSDEDFRNKIVEVVDEQLIDLNDADDGILSWKNLVEFLDCSGYQVLTRSIHGFTMETNTVYPLPEYGWDGGNAINTIVINITRLVNSDVFFGPIATIVQRTDSSKPGVAIHEYDSQILFQIL